MVLYVYLFLLASVPVVQHVDHGLIFSNVATGCRLYAVSDAGSRELPCADGPVREVPAAPLLPGEVYLILPA